MMWNYLNQPWSRVLCIFQAIEVVVDQLNWQNLEKFNATHSGHKATDTVRPFFEKWSIYLEGCDHLEEFDDLGFFEENLRLDIDNKSPDNHKYLFKSIEFPFILAVKSWAEHVLQIVVNSFATIRITSHHLAPHGHKLFLSNFCKSMGNDQSHSTCRC